MSEEPHHAPKPAGVGIGSRPELTARLGGGPGIGQA